MKQAQIYKSADAGAPDERDLELIGKYARRKLSGDEVYTFSMVLCDNQVDRDGERFTAQALKELCPLFEGKTGIFDHNPRGREQTARIYSTWVDEDPARQSPGGESYHCLRAKAYMVRSELTSPLILEIDGGIKKEVSVGCAVGDIRCSVCGADIRKEPCAHKKGRFYNGRECFHELSKPTDAYEWSFVAVPAQVSAGVTKGILLEAGLPRPLIKKLISPGGEDAQISAQEAQNLKRLAIAGKEYLDSLRADIVRLSALAGLEIDAALLGSVADRMDTGELLAFKKALSKAAGLTGGLQTVRKDKREAGASPSQFKI